MTAPAVASPKAAKTPPGLSANREKERLAARYRTGRFLLYAEGLFAFGFGQGSVLLNLKENDYLRDLPRPGLTPPHSPYTHSPYSGHARAAGARADPARSAPSPSPAQLATFVATLDAKSRETITAHADALDMKVEAFKTWYDLESIRSPIARLQRLKRAGLATRHHHIRLERLSNLQRHLASTHSTARIVSEHATARFRLLMSIPRLRPRNAVSGLHRGLKTGTTEILDRHKRWWETLKRQDHDGVAYRVPPAWEDLAPEGLVYSHVGGAYGLGDVHSFSFTLRLDEATQTLARKEHLPAAWLRDRIVRRLKQALGRKADVLVVLEEDVDANGNPVASGLHAHGVVVASRAETDAVKDALCRAGGAWPKWRNRQAHLAAKPDSGWASYLVKDFDKPFPGPRFAATRGLTEAAKGFHQALRELVMEHTANKKADLEEHEVEMEAAKSVTGDFCENTSIISNNNTCTPARLNLAMSRGNTGEAKCTSALLRQNSSVIFTKTCKARDGPMRDRCGPIPARIRHSGHARSSRTGARALFVCHNFPSPDG